MKNTGYVYANKALESAVKELKSSFFDIFYHSQGTLLMLMTQLDELEVDSDVLKEEAVDLINSQGTLLSETMSLVEELIRSIKKIDNNGKKIDTFNRKYVIDRGKNFTKIERKTTVAAVPTTEVKTEIVTEASTEVQTEPVTEATTEVQTKAVTETSTEVQTEPVTETATEVQAEVAAEVATEVQTEPVTEATAEVQTEAVTEVATEVQTEPVIEATTEVQTEAVTETTTEVQTEVSTTLTGLEIDPNAPVEEATEPSTEKPKKYIADTPEGVTKDLKQALLTMPGMEDLKFDSNGRPDFTSVLPQNVLDEFNSKFGFQVSVKKTLADMENVEFDGATEAIVPNEATMDLPFATESVIPTPAPPAPPATNSVSQSELTTEAVTEAAIEAVIPTVEVATEAQTEAVIPAVEVATEAQIEAVIPAVEVATEAQAEAVIPAVEVATESQTEAVIPAVEVATEAQTEAVIPTVEVATEAQTEAIIPTVEVATESQTELSIPGVQVAMPVEESTEVVTETQTEVATELSIPGVQIAMPTEGDAVEGGILPFGEAATEVVTEVVTEVQTEAPTEEETIRKFNDQSTNVRAILVSDNQYNKLAGSRVTQEALLIFKRVLPEKGHNGTHIVSVDANAAISTVPSTDNMTAEDKNRTIEAMMVDANNLYNAGKVAEAQALYDKISEINKTLVKS